MCPQLGGREQPAWRSGEACSRVGGTDFRAAGGPGGGEGGQGEGGGGATGPRRGAECSAYGAGGQSGHHCRAARATVCVIWEKDSYWSTHSKLASSCMKVERNGPKVTQNSLFKVAKKDKRK